MRKASAILLSGGLDSAAVAYWKRPEFGITIDYGHAPAKGELRASKEIARALGIKHVHIKVPLAELGGGALLNQQPLVGSPTPEWWPFRNQVLVTLAAMKCSAMDVKRLLIGTVKSDRQHADGKPQFVFRLSALLRMQECGIVLDAPAIEMTTADLLKKSKLPPALAAWTHSCHKAAFPCGRCRGCLKRREALLAAELPCN